MTITNDPKTDPVAATLARMEARLDNALTEPRACRLIPYEEHKAAVRAAYRRGYRDGLMRVLGDLRKANTAALEQLARAAEDDGEDSRVYRAR